MTKTLQIRNLIKLAGVALLIHAGSAIAAPLSAPEVGSYLNGGIGVDGRQAMHAERKHYNLQMRFAHAKTGEYLSAVSVTITPQAKKGEPLHVEDAGPYLYVRLHPGRYRVTATAEGRTQKRSVSVGKAATELVLYWP